MSWSPRYTYNSVYRRSHICTDECTYKFIEFCKYGMISDAFNLEFKHEIDIHMNKEEAFRSACEGGYFSVVKYLIEKCTNTTRYKPIDIHTYNEDAFVSACAKGSLSIVKYLAELHMNDTESGHNYGKIDIHVHNENPLYYACKNGHLSIVKYLMELHITNPNYTKIDSSQGIQIAREKGHTHIVEYLTNFDKTPAHKVTYF